MKKTGLYKKMLTMAVAPILILGLSLTVFCYTRFTNTIYEQAQEDMINVARSVMLAYDMKYNGDYYPVKDASGNFDFYKGEADITNETQIVDDFKKATGAEISVLYMDMRVNTTFASYDGTRFAGVCTNEDTTEKVFGKGQIAKYENVKMFNDEYLIVYVPLKNSDGSTVGMVEVAKPTSSMQKSVIHSVWPILVFALGFMLFGAIVSYRSTKEITDVLSKLQTFMNKVAGGNLTTELDIDVLKRTDELGEISKSATSMQKSIRGFVETDPLTKLGNRRFFLNQTERVITRSQASGLPFSIAIADIDFFKKVNDTYGHNAGDEVLKAVANKLKQAMTSKGFAARWGGEEFVLCFDKCDMHEAAQHLWKTLESIREMVVSTEGFDIKITMTFGVVDGYPEKIERLIELADEKLYYGKQNGRNRVVTTIEAAPEKETEPEPAPAPEPTPEEPKAEAPKKRRTTKKKTEES